MFFLPHHLHEMGLLREVWADYPFEAIIFDLRDGYEKTENKKNRLATTFKKKKCDVWQDRPLLMNFENVAS